MSPELSTCAECGMAVSPGEYHPYATCLMFKACHDGDQVRQNLDAVRGRSAQQDADRLNAVYEAGWREAALWAGRDDLIADIGSPAYERDKDEALKGAAPSSP